MSGNNHQRERCRRPDQGAVGPRSGEFPRGLVDALAQSVRVAVHALCDQRLDEGRTGMAVVPAGGIDGIQHILSRIPVDAGYVDVGEADGHTSGPLAAIAAHLLLQGAFP
jgi:hypothetical protein